MRGRSIVSVFVVVLTLGIPVFAEEAAVKSPWDGFGVGSWVVTRTTSKFSQAGVAAKPTVSEVRLTLTAISDSAYTVKREAALSGPLGVVGLPSQSEDYPRVPPKPVADAGAKVEDLGKENLIVDGASVECSKEKTTSPGGTEVKWSNDKYGLVRSEFRSKDETVNVTELKSMKAVLKVKGKDVRCRLEAERWTWKTPRIKTITSTWTSDEIPGGVVRWESSDTSATGTLVDVWEVTDFAKK